MCIDIVEIWFGIASGQILSIFDSYLSATCLYFRFRDINLSKCQGIFFIKLGMCIDIEEIWFGIAYGHISSIFDRVICPHFQMITWVSVNGFSPKLGAGLDGSVGCISNWRSGHGVDPCQVWQHSIIEIDHEIFSMVILSLLLIQEGQLSVSGKRMHTYWLTCPGKSWLGKLTSLT